LVQVLDRRETFIWTKNQNLTKVSLSVEKENFAVNLYQQEGFKVYIDNPGDYTMLWEA